MKQTPQRLRIYNTGLRNIRSNFSPLFQKRENDKPEELRLECEHKVMNRRRTLLLCNVSRRKPFLRAPALLNTSVYSSPPSSPLFSPVPAQAWCLGLQLLDMSKKDDLFRTMSLTDEASGCFMSHTELECDGEGKRSGLGLMWTSARRGRGLKEDLWNPALSHHMERISQNTRYTEPRRRQGLFAGGVPDSQLSSH